MNLNFILNIFLTHITVGYKNSSNEKFGVLSPIECNQLKSIAIYCVILLILSLLSNSILLIILIRHKEFRNTTSIFMICLAILNLLGSLFEFPFVILSNFNCRWIFGKSGCIFSGFIMFFIGASSIYLLVALSFERYLIIKRHTKRRYINLKLTLLILVGCILFSLFWSVAPFFGWSYYSMESSLTTCCVEWRDKSNNVVSYNINIFVFIYFIPLILIIQLNVKSVFMIKDLNKFAKNLKQTRIAKKRVKFERNLAFKNSIIIGFYFISWSPYAFISMYNAFIDSTKIKPLTTLIPSMFAKSTFLWTSFIHIIFDKRVKRKISNSFNGSWLGKPKNVNNYKFEFKFNFNLIKSSQKNISNMDKTSKSLISK